MHTIDHSDKVPGLFVVHDAVSIPEEIDLVDNVNKQSWSGLGIGYGKYSSCFSLNKFWK
jgi:hypothetical protein